jgi:transcription antitermination factor NusG
MPVEAPAEMDDQEKLTEPELVSVVPEPELEPAAEAAAETVAEKSVEGVGAESEGATAATMTPAQEHRAAAAEGLRRGRLPQGEVPVEGGSEPAWYVIHCYSGYENKVRHNLEQRIETMGMKDRIFDVVIPTQEEIEVREGKRRTVERHIFPGYVLVNMTLSEESWYVVRNTPGVTGFVGMGNLPTPLRPEEVSQIIKRMESEERSPTSISSARRCGSWSPSLGARRRSNWTFCKWRRHRQQHRKKLLRCGRATHESPVKTTVPADIPVQGVNVDGKEIQGNRSTAAGGRQGQSGAARGPRAGGTRDQHHGVLQRVQLADV